MFVYLSSIWPVSRPEVPVRRVVWSTLKRLLLLLLRYHVLGSILRQQPLAPPHHSHRHHNPTHHPHHLRMLPESATAGESTPSRIPSPISGADQTSAEEHLLPADWEAPLGWVQRQHVEERWSSGQWAATGKSPQQRHHVRGVTSTTPTKIRTTWHNGPKMALAYNEYTFVPMTRTTPSVLFTSPSEDPGKPNEPAGGTYYHSLGQTLNLQFDQSKSGGAGARN